MSAKKIPDFLKTFPDKHVSSLLRHFAASVREFQQAKWEDSISKAGKFVEAVLKSLWVYAGQTLPSERAFKVDSIINDLAKLPSHDSVRIVIPRACRFVYDIASNRGGRHDPGEVDPNEMDATVAVANCSWIVAEMIRVSQRGQMDLTRAKGIVDSLIEKRYPLIERVEERVYFHGDKSAPDVVLLALADKHPGRISKQDLVATVRRHGFELDNARRAVERAARFVDDDGNGHLRLLAPGLKKAEQIRSRIQTQEAVPRRRRPRTRREA